ncbi:MAG: response regulator [Rhodospirillales bacterium]|jgi:DNA-binding response OmpR family regulator|nr:response regulator [Rhodospirillales bacterium]HIJ43070.1 response regulator [Rhodospirillaceae bacterium]
MESQYLEKVKFLIVEDNAFMRAVLFQALKALGAGEVRMASNGADGLKELQDYQADIAIVDWEMQPVNGIEFVKTVRRSDDSPNPFLPIIMLTGYSEMRRIIEARDAGVNEFVVKPISANTLFERIEALIERPRPFVRLEGFFGPDRRRKSSDPARDERRQEMKKKKKKKKMTQDEINVLINPTPEEAESTSIETKSGGGGNTGAADAS